MSITSTQVQALREKTGCGMMDCKKVLVETDGNEEKAIELLRKKGMASAAKRAGWVAAQGLVESYIHQNGRVGALVEVSCETDFVARTDIFKNLVHEICMQIAAMNPKDVKALLEQEYIRDGSRKMGDLIKEAIAKLGENIVVKRLQRFEIGE